MWPSKIIGLVSTGRGRLGFLLAWGAVSLAWVAGSGLILDMVEETTAAPGTTLVTIQLLRVTVFLVVSGVLFYPFLGPPQAGGGIALQPLRRLASAAPIGCGLVDQSGLLLYANPLLLRLLEINTAVIGHIDLQGLFAGQLPPHLLARRAHEWGRTHETVISLQYASGRKAKLSVMLGPTEDAPGSGQRLLFVSDVTGLQHAAETSALYGDTLEALQAGIVICDAGRDGFPMLYVNRSFQEATGFARDELIGSPCSMLQGQDRNQSGAQMLAEALQRGEPATVLLRNYRKSGELFWVEMRVSPLFDGQGRLSHYVGLQQDITAERAESELLHRRLREDGVTTALSRTGFVDALTALLADPAHDGVLLVRLDLQNFHEFNTALGWDVGDELLKQVAKRAEAAAAGGVVGRLESNQFGLALPIAPHRAAETIAALHDRLQTRYLLPGTICEPMISLGWALGVAGMDTRELLRQASIALNEARATRSGVVRQYKHETALVIQERRRLTAELSQAVREHDFVVHYQPRVELRTGRIVAAEALIRWNHPLFGLQAAKRFMSLAEVTGLIANIGEISLTEAIRVTAEINHHRASVLPISVNLSTGQYRRPNFVRWLERMLIAANASPSWLQLELPEHLFISADAHTLETARQLHALGVDIILNDFAPSVSALRNLADQPVAEIKIDGGLVANIERDVLSYAAVNAVMSIARAKQTRVTAQAVETERQRRVLLELGCERGQGFLFAASLPAQGYLDLLARGSALPETDAAVDRYKPAPS